MTPCENCPWARKSTPGALGTISPAETYVGQAVIPFWLPCHESPNYRDKATDVNEVAQCTGAAIFRTNIGLTRERMPTPIALLPENHELVFSSLAEFYAHHKGIPVSEAAKILTPGEIRRLAWKEWTDANVQMQLRLRKPSDPRLGIR
jgi:hypothetical protein